MGARELNHPRTERQDRTQAPWNWAGAPLGTIRNAPHDSLPPGALAGIVNAHAFPTEAQPRLASWLYDEIQPPVLEDDEGNPRSGYTAEKDGDIITVTGAAIFTDADVSHYWVWPEELANEHDEIQEVLSGNQVRVGLRGTKAATSGCWMHARLNCWGFHETEQKMVRQWGIGMYVADGVDMSSWTKALCVSRLQPANAMSDWDIQGKHMFFASSSGLFLLDFKPSIPQLFQMNSPVPDTLIESTIESKVRTHRYDYLYSLARIEGVGIRDRRVPGLDVLQESGTTGLVPTSGPPRDYGSMWSEYKISDGVKTQGRLVGAPMAAANRTPTYWRTLTGAASGVFQILVDGELENFVIDFGAPGYDVENMGDVVNALQRSVRISFPFATVSYETNTGQVTFTSGERESSTIGWGQVGIGAGYTDIAAVMMILEADGGSLNNAYPYARPLGVGILTMPTVPGQGSVRQQHWTHYPVYRSEDNGPGGIEPKIDDYGNSLPPVEMTWVYDIRCAAAFYGCKDEQGLFTAQSGRFEIWDEGTPFEWHDGEIDTIYRYVDPLHVYLRPQEEGRDYYEGAKCGYTAIGGGRVFGASQAGDIVTRVKGRYFTRADERKTMTWANGYYSIAVEYLDAYRMRVHDFIDKARQGMTMDPTQRLFTDPISDEVLRDRQGELHIGYLNHRFYTPLPNCNLLRVVPGFLITARRNTTECNYCQIAIAIPYLAGYHLPNRQKLDKIDGSIQWILKAPNYFIMICAGSMWGGPTNIPDIAKLPRYGQAYNQLHVDVLHKEIGCVDIGSIKEIDEGVFEMYCSDGTWRQFVGLKFGEDLSRDPTTGQDRIQKDLEECWNLGASAYSDELGHVRWGKVRQ